jgi:hypothetical protein
MPSPEQIRHQIERLTTDLIGLSLCDDQNFPSMRNLDHGLTEVSFGGKRDISAALKNDPYCVVYDKLKNTRTYNLKMVDGALIQMMFRFNKEEIEAHRLAFFPSPYLEEFQKSPEIYLADEIYAEVVMKSIVPFPLRFDFNSREDIATELEHPKTHLTLGHYENCRIPVSAPLTPYLFISFVLRNFYHTAYLKYCEKISVYNDGFVDTIKDHEANIIHVRLPVRV